MQLWPPGWVGERVSNAMQCNAAAVSENVLKILLRIPVQTVAQTPFNTQSHIKETTIPHQTFLSALLLDLSKTAKNSNNEKFLNKTFCVEGPQTRYTAYLQDSKAKVKNRKFWSRTCIILCEQNSIMLVSVGWNLEELAAHNSFEQQPDQIVWTEWRLNWKSTILSLI